MKRARNRKGMTLLLENITFIILNLIFIGILVAFLLTRANTASILEEKYAKEIALMLDSARPGMEIILNMTDAFLAAEKNLGKNNVNNLVTISGNIVNVNLGTPRGYSYSFFNNVNIANYYIDKENKDYIFFIGDG